jgi:hypothetical protein
MTLQEFEYIKRAMKTLEGPVSLMERIKIQRTMSQILGRSADKMEEAFVDQNMANSKVLQDA